MTTSPPPARTPGQRAGLDRSQVLDAAMSLLTADGLEGVTMRALAGRLGVSPNALYSHVSDKDELLDGVLDEVLAKVDPPASDGIDPREGLFEVMASTYDVLVDHADLVSLYLARQGARGPNAHRLGDIMIDLLGRAGVTGPQASEALQVLVIHTIGFAAFTTSARLGPIDRPEQATELAANFHRSLRWLLAGITT